MISLDIKTKIAILTAALLLTGMVLLDLVMVTAIQQHLIHSEKSKCLLLIKLLGKKGDLSVGFQVDNPARRSNSTSEIQPFLAAVRVNLNGAREWSVDPLPQLKKPLHRLVLKSVNSQNERFAFHGTTWGVFWKQSKYLLSAAPYFKGGDITGYAGVAVPLDPIFEQLRETQKLIAVYLFINTFILTVIGMYRIYGLAVRPVSKMTHLAESYRPEDGTFLLEESEEDEHSRLTRSINRILKLNREDHEKLEQTVLQLEGALTELRQAHDKIIRSEKLATVGRLSAGIAHEIGNPIGIVLGYLSLLKEKGVKEEDRTDYINRAETEVNRIRKIIRQLLDYSSPSKDNLKKVSIHELIDETVEMTKLQPLFSKIEVKAELAAENDQVFANSDQLRQLLLNFIMNTADAFDTTDDRLNGKLHVKSENMQSPDLQNERHKTMIKISFEDNGQGICRGDLEKIFDPFFSTKPAGKGSGLGLWVSLVIAENLGGKIVPESEPGKGTTMNLYLPTIDPEDS